MAKYIINGKEYTSIDDVPAEFRHFLEDKDGDGQSDYVQKQLELIRGAGGLDGVNVSLSNGSGSSVSSVTMTTVNGKTRYQVGDQSYNSLEDMPPEHRKMFQNLGDTGRLNEQLSSLLGGHSGIPHAAPAPPRPSPQPANPPAAGPRWEEPRDSSSFGMMLFIAGVLVGGLAMAAALAAMFLF